jgi:hypothetical protein
MYHSQTHFLPITTPKKRDLESIALTHGMSIDEFVTLAIAEKLSRIDHQAWVLKQASRSSPANGAKPEA